MNPTLSDRLCSVIQALYDTGHIEDSCSGDIPKPIRKRHSIHRAVQQLNKSYPGARLPIRGTLARYLGISHVRVTQVLRLLKGSNVASLSWDRRKDLR